VISNVGKNAGDPMQPDRGATPHKSKVTIAFEKLQFLEYGTKMITENTKLFLYTDGLLNLNYDHEEFLSFKELKYVLQKECVHAKTEEVISFFERGINSIDVEEDLKDDISMLAIEIS
jgi:hypothetical protein